MHEAPVVAGDPPVQRRTRWVHDFAAGDRSMRALLGGKGANLAEMTRVLGPERVPAGFTVTTEACVAYLQAGGSAPPGLAEEVDDALERLETHAGKRLGDAGDPLLVSVRSGARDSMPGMLDTVLNLGLDDRSVLGLADRTGDERFAWDSYRRLVQMFGNVVRGVPGDVFEDAIARAKRQRGVALDSEKLLDRSPFETIDEDGVGALLGLAVRRERGARPDLALGICGEHGRDPDSIRFFHRAGLDYVSCSPFRVPIARIAAAQAAIADGARPS